MFTTINGWTKERMKDRIRERNTGSLAEIEGECCYATKDNNHCAVGCFIEDVTYGEALDYELVLCTADQVAYQLAELRCKRDKHADVWVHEEQRRINRMMPLDDAGMLRMQREHDHFLSASLPPDQDMRDVLCNWIDANVEDGEA